MRFMIGALLAAAVPASAPAIEVVSSGSGACFTEALNTACNNTDPTVRAYNPAGVYAYSFPIVYRDWFAFDIPLGTYEQAKLRIYNPIEGYTVNAGFYLYSAATISFQTLVKGPVLGQASTGDIHFTDNGYFTITLNAAGVAEINRLAGQRIIFGGAVDGGPANRDNIVSGSNGTPPALLEIGDLPPPPPPPPTGVPEPAQWAVLIAGFAMAGARLRARTLASL